MGPTQPFVALFLMYTWKGHKRIRLTWWLKILLLAGTTVGAAILVDPETLGGKIVLGAFCAFVFALIQSFVCIALTMSLEGRYPNIANKLLPTNEERMSLDF